MDDQTRALPDPEVTPTVPLWPTAGRAMGFGKQATYEAAARGEFPGLIRLGRKYRVATAALRRHLELQQSPDAA